MEPYDPTRYETRDYLQSTRWEVILQRNEQIIARNNLLREQERRRKLNTILRLARDIGLFRVNQKPGENTHEC